MYIVRIAQIKQLNARDTHTTANVSSVADWTFNVSSNTRNLSINGKSTNGNEISFRTSGKYIYSVTKKRPFVYEVVLQIRNISISDEGQYSLQVKSDGENGPGKTILLHLKVQGNLNFMHLSHHYNVITIFFSMLYIISCHENLRKRNNFCFKRC